MSTDACECPTFGASGEKLASTKLNADIFGAQVLPDIIHQIVRWQRAKRRSGTHSVLTRSNIKGGAKKPWKQKGTGRARAGSSVSPIWVGGAVVHGPTPRSYEFRMPKALRSTGLKCALSLKVQQGELGVIDTLPNLSGKTARAVEFLGKVGSSESKVLLVVGAAEGDTKLAFRNLPKVTVVPVGGVNVYDLVNSNSVLVSKSAVSELEMRITGVEK